MPDPAPAVGPGEIAALVTSVLWAGTALLFGAAARRGPAGFLNLLRLCVATLLLTVTAAVMGSLRPVPPGQALCLVLSGVLGLAAGDVGYFRALAILGPRRAALMMSLAPVFTALAMVPLLHETLGLPGILGMGMTLGGVAWVQAERAQDREIQGSVRTGVAWGLVGALGQAAGAIFAKPGLGTAPADSPLAAWAGLAETAATTTGGTATAGVPVDALTGTLVRMVAAAVVVGVVALFALRRDGPAARAALKDPIFVRAALAASVCGPFLGVWLFLFAVQHANTAVAATIIASSPVFVIPLVRIVHGHTTSARAWAGAILAMAGVALLALRQSL